MDKHRDLSNTITLTDPSEIRDFTLGQRLDDMSEEDARAILGDPAYEAWQKMKADPSRKTGSATITSIDCADRKICISK